MMNSRTYTQEELSSLLQSLAEDATTVLMDTSPQSHQYFCENFASLSLKAFKYVRFFLNQVSSNQRVGNTIDRIFKIFTQSMHQYKGRNIQAHSVCPQNSDHHEQDEIYHFLNTRNRQIPADLLNNYQSQKQRLELQQFVQQLESQQRFTAKKVKRKPIPAQQTYNSNSGRKTTLSTDLKIVQQQETNQIISVAVSTPVKTIENRHIQIQTENQQSCERKQSNTRNCIDNYCQYEYVPQHQIVPSIGTNYKKNNQNNRKSGGKKNGQKGNSKPRKATFNDEASIRSKQSSYHLLKPQNSNEKSLPVIDSKTSPQLQPYSLKSFKTNEQFNMEICQRVLHIAIQGGVSCDLLTQNGLNKSMRTISRKKVATGGQIKTLKSTTKIDDDQLLKGNKNQNLSSWKPQLRKESSIMDKAKANQQLYSEESQLQSNKEKGNKQRTNNEKDNIIDHQQHPQYQKEKQKFCLQPVKRGTRQRVSIVNVKIVDQKLHVSEDIVHSNHSQQISNLKRQSIKNQNETSSLQKTEFVKKNAAFSNFKEAEKYQIGQRQDHVKQVQYSKDSKKTHPIAASIDLENNNLHQVEDQILNADLAQMLNCYAQKNNNYQQKQAIKGNQYLTNSKNTSKHSEGVKSSSHSLSSSGDMMIIFSNKSKAAQDQNLFTIANKENQSGGQLGNNIQIQKRNIQTSQQKLSTIMETGRTQECNSNLQSKFASLSKFRSNECKTVGNASRSLSKLLNRQNSQSTPIKTSLHRLKKEICQTRDSSNIFQNQSVNSASHHASKSSFSRDQLKRKLRNRANKEKLQWYLELVEATHKKFCGEDCEHIQRLLEGKDGNINEQLVRLFNKTK